MRFREKMARFMVGRNGSDELTRFLSVLVCICLVASMFMEETYSILLWALALTGVVYSYFRVFSKRVYKRREENDRYLRARNSFFGYFRAGRERFRQRKDYAFFRCTSCHTMLRVPRGKGKIKIVCKKCGNSFVKST